MGVAPNLVRCLPVANEAVTMRPMILEEAIKESHLRDPKGKVMILHRTGDGKMGLIAR
jgi:hypothetical protein